RGRRAATVRRRPLRRAPRPRAARRLRRRRLRRPPRLRAPLNEPGSAKGDDAMNLPIVWWVVLPLLAVQALLWKRRAGTFFWTLVSWFSIWVFLRFGFTVP